MSPKWAYVKELVARAWGNGWKSVGLRARKIWCKSVLYMILEYG